MKQISAKLNSYVNNVNIINNNDLGRFTLHFIFWSFGTLAFIYVLLLGNMVMNIVERRSLETNAQTLGNEVRNLELTYLSISNNIDLPLSYSLGFKETKANFAVHKALGMRSLDSVKTLQNDL